MKKIKHEKNHLGKITQFLKKYFHRTNNHKFEAQEQSKNVAKVWLKLFTVLIFITISLLIIAGKNKTTAEILIDEFVAALKSQMGFDYNADPLSDYVFSKNTPNYNAYAADKKLAGTHRMLFERDGMKLEIKFKSAEFSAKKLELAKVDLLADESTPGATVQPNPIQSTLSELNSELEEITTGLSDISKKISSLQQEVSEIKSKARMIPENNERKVKYEDIVFGTDIIYGLDEEGLKQEIIIKNQEDINNIFSFTLLNPDLTYEDMGRGVWYFSNKENKVMRIPKGYATDANGKFTNAVNIQINTTLLVNIMTVEVPTDWLLEKERVFPIKIHTAFEIVPELRDGNSRAPSDNNEVTPDKVTVTESTNSAVLNASESADFNPSDSANLNATESSKVQTTQEPSGLRNE